MSANRLASLAPLVSAQELHALLQTPDTPIVADCRHNLANAQWAAEAFASARIPGAIFVSIDDDLSAKPNGRNGRHPLPAPAEFAQRLGQWGIGNHSHVVVYDQGSGMFAARLWWMLRWLGHTQVQVLDGGFAQWEKLGLPIEAGPATSAKHPATTFTPAVQDYMLRTVAQTQASLGDGKTLILDARAPERFRGDVEPLDPVAGHIPGAQNRPFAENFRDGLMKPAAELREEYLRLLAGRPTSSLIHQCGSGVTALANVLAMEHAGLPGSTLYAGSWSEWCSDPARPVETGPARPQ